MYKKFSIFMLSLFLCIALAVNAFAEGNIAEDESQEGGTEHVIATWECGFSSANDASSGVMEVSSISSVENTPLQGFHWEQDVLVVYVDDYIPGIPEEYHNDILSAICEGIMEWNGLNYCINIIFTDSYYTNDFDVYVNVAECFDTVIWKGTTIVDHDDNDDTIAVEAHIQFNSTLMYKDLNENGFFDYTLDLDCWKAVACHEFGHVLGLDHSDSAEYGVSIMGKYIEYYYNPVTGNPALTSPMDVDIMPLEDLYAHTFTYVNNNSQNLDWLKKHKIAKCQPYALNYPA